MNNTYKLGLFAGLTLAAMVPLSRAQTAAATPEPSSTTTTTTTTTTTAPAAASSDTVTMEKFDVSDVPPEKQILPTSRPFASVFGTDDSVMDIPRNVTIISRAQMDTIDIQDVTEFSKLTSSSYTDSNFGSPANPSIRGQSADVFENGMRLFIGESGDGIPLDFNSVESVNIIPGPATAVQGTSNYVGGFVDLISKQPFFDGYKSSISYTYGSYNANRWTLDTGGPITDKLAYRVSYSGEDSDGYYYDWIRQTTSIYGALTWRPNSVYELFVNVKGYWADYRENFGINRPTQALIDDGYYVPGTNVNNGTAATAADPQNAANVTGSDTIDFGAPVKIDYRETAQGPASHAHGMAYNAQAIQTLHLASDVKIVNNTMYSYTKRDTFNSDGYSEIIDPSWFIDNRTEFIINKPTWELNTGLEEKYQNTRAYDDFFFEPVNVWDLSAVNKRSTLNSYLASGPGGFLGQPVPGFEDRYFTPAIGTFGGNSYFDLNDDSNLSSAAVLSPFIQGTWKLTDKFSIISGARLDILHVQVRDPYFLTAAAQLTPVEPNANLSFLYKYTPTWSTYLTYNYSQNFSGDGGDGGGFGLYADANGNPTIPRSLFAEASQLYEYGNKIQVLNEKMFISTDIFYQTRQSKPQGSPVEQYQYYGAEISANYQPDKHFFSTLGYSFINGSLPASTDPFQAYDTQQIPGGPPNPNTNPVQTTGRYRAPGQPLHTFNALASYTFDDGFGLESNVLYTSPMNNDYQGYLVIPWQYSLDAAVFYKTKHWEYRLTGKNLTNQHNWEPSVATYALEGIVPLPAVTVYGTIKYKF
jgi:catecholate siderophore receptor